MATSECIDTFSINADAEREAVSVIELAAETGCMAFNKLEGWRKKMIVHHMIGLRDQGKRVNVANVARIFGATEGLRQNLYAVADLVGVKRVLRPDRTTKGRAERAARLAATHAAAECVGPVRLATAAPGDYVVIVTPKGVL